MSSKTSNGTRRRAVRLNAKARTMLAERLDEVWQLEAPGRRMTAEDRAKMLDVSVVTARKILGGEGVDRSSLIVAFEKLGLEWKESYCEHVAAPSLDETKAKESDPEPKLAAPSRRWAWLAATIACIGIAPIGLWKFAAPTSGKSPGQLQEDHAQVLVNQATDEYNRGDYRLALSHALEAENLARINKNAPILANADVAEGMIDVERGDYARATQCYMDALHAHCMLGDFDCMPALYDDLAEIESRTGHLASAKAHLIDCLNGYSRMRDPSGVVIATRDLGSVESQGGNLAEAQHWFDVALTTVAPLHKEEMEADIQGREALVLRDEHRFDEARALLAKATAYWQAHHHDRWIATCLLNTGTVEVVAGNYATAERLLEQSKSLYGKVGDKPGVLQCDAWLGKSKPQPVMAANTLSTKPPID